MPAGLLREFKLRFPLLGHDAPSSGVPPIPFIKEPFIFIGRTANSISLTFYPKEIMQNPFPKLMPQNNTDKSCKPHNNKWLHYK